MDQRGNGPGRGQYAAEAYRSDDDEKDHDRHVDRILGGYLDRLPGKPAIDGGENITRYNTEGGRFPGRRDASKDAPDYREYHQDDGGYLSEACLDFLRERYGRDLIVRGQGWIDCAADDDIADEQGGHHETGHDDGEEELADRDLRDGAEENGERAGRYEDRECAARNDRSQGHGFRIAPFVHLRHEDLAEYADRPPADADHGAQKNT